MPLLTQQQIAAGKLAADSLHSKLNQIYQHDLLVFGHHDSLAYGRSNGGWRAASPTNNNALNLSIDKTDISIALDNNDAAGLFGWDLIGLEDIPNAASIDLTKSTAKLRNNIPVKDVIAWIKKVHNSGGINTVCWHMKNPSTGDDYNDVSNPNTINEVITASTNANKTFTNWLSKAVNFFSSLIDDNGNPIPVIFRPFHEVTNFSAFFWWNQIDHTNSTVSDYKQLWENTITYLNDKGIENLVNAFCINDFFIDGNTGRTFDKIREMIPDTSLFDIICFDGYQRLNTQQQNNNHPHCQTCQIADSNFDTNNFVQRMRLQLDEINQLAIELYKIPAIGEIGADYFFDNTSWWCGTLQQIIADKNIAYLMTWRNPPYQEGDLSSYYSAYYNPNGKDISDVNTDFVNDFIQFYNDNACTNSRVLFLNEMNSTFG